ncbi:MAG: A/G-specific adenine glycosylase [Bacteroidetes bacterium]|nr:A/G-specific adenine glycosylase [Bacteroidota bacterium]MDA1120625.1 A/G-specific adenine glycosylase [Bacteroidota bacterium]
MSENIHPIAIILIAWYNQNKRDLPWRGTKNPFRIWLSEIILQQTRVEQGLPYYDAFVSRFENIKQLARAPEDEILRLWQGLGYYSRAKNLHLCAKYVATELNGVFPGTYRELLKLRGIGSYTAAAIASIAFDERVPTIDGNVFRVLSRIFGIKNDISQSKYRVVFFDQALSMMPGISPSVFNQAMMEFGALQCIPRKPDCPNCPVVEMCYAFSNREQDLLPVNNKKLKIRKRYFNYPVFFYENRILMKKRNNSDIWKGLYDFHLIEFEHQMNLESLIEKLNKEISPSVFQSSFINQSKDYQHILTHQRIHARFFKIGLKDSTFAKELASKLNLISFSKTEIEKIPKPRLIEKYLIDEGNFLIC